MGMKRSKAGLPPTTTGILVNEFYLFVRARDEDAVGAKKRGAHAEMNYQYYRRQDNKELEDAPNSLVAGSGAVCGSPHEVRAKYALTARGLLHW